MRKNDWNHPLPFGDSVWVKKSDVEPLVKAVRKILDEIYEFGSVVSNEYVELAESAYISLVGDEAVEHSVQRIWGTVAQNDDLPNEKMCATCGHSESRHQTAGGFCKHCTCNEFVEPATTPNR